MRFATQLRNLGPSALLVSFLSSTAFAFQVFVTERGTFEDDGGHDWWVGLSQTVVGAGSVPFILATLLVIRRDNLLWATKLLYRVSALVALGQAIFAMSWIALEWRNIYRDGAVSTQITTAFAAALLALVALQPSKGDGAFPSDTPEGFVIIEASDEYGDRDASGVLQQPEQVSPSPKV